MNTITILIRCTGYTSQQANAEEVKEILEQRGLKGTGLIQFMHPDSKQRFLDARCDVEDTPEHREILNKWFPESNNQAPPFKPGTLLHFSYHTPTRTPRDLSNRLVRSGAQAVVTQYINLARCLEALDVAEVKELCSKLHLQWSNPESPQEKILRENVHAIIHRMLFVCHEKDCGLRFPVEDEESRHQ